MTGASERSTHDLLVSIAQLLTEILTEIKHERHAIDNLLAIAEANASRRRGL